jgi:hypothetical protein
MKTCCVCNRTNATATRLLDSRLFRHNASEQMEKCIRRSNVDQPKKNIGPCALEPSVPVHNSCTTVAE